MTRKTRNNILKYAIAMVIVSVILLGSMIFLECIKWLNNKTGIPVTIVVIIISYICMVWYICKDIKIKEE